MKPLTLDTAVREFKDYCQGNGDFDELDFKEYIIDVYCKQKVDWAVASAENILDHKWSKKCEQQEIKARIDELMRFTTGNIYECSSYSISGKELYGRITELTKELKEME